MNKRQAGLADVISQIVTYIICNNMLIMFGVLLNL